MHLRRHLNRFFGSLRKKTKENLVEGQEIHSSTSKKADSFSGPGTASTSGSGSGNPKKPFSFSQLNSSIRRSLKGNKENSLSRCQLLDLDDQNQDDVVAVEHGGIAPYPLCSASSQQILYDTNNDVISHEHETVRNSPRATRVYTDDSGIETQSESNSISLCNVNVHNNTSDSFNKSSWASLLQVHANVTVQVNVCVDVDSNGASSSPAYLQRKRNDSSVDEAVDKLLFVDVDDDEDEDIVTEDEGITKRKLSESASVINSQTIFSSRTAKIKESSNSTIDCHQPGKKSSKKLTTSHFVTCGNGDGATATDKATLIAPERKSLEHVPENEICDASLKLNQPSTSPEVKTTTNKSSMAMAVSKIPQKKMSVKEVRKSAKRVGKAVKEGLIFWAQTMTYQYATTVLPELYECPPMASLDYPYNQNGLPNSYPWLQHRHYHVRDNFELQMHNPNHICQMPY